MSNRQRSAFLLFDGKRTLLEVLKSSSGLGITALDVDDLVSKGLLEQATGNVAVPAVPECGCGRGAPGQPVRRPTSKSETQTLPG